MSRIGATLVAQLAGVVLFGLFFVGLASGRPWLGGVAMMVGGLVLLVYVLARRPPPGR